MTNMLPRPALPDLAAISGSVIPALSIAIVVILFGSQVGKLAQFGAERWERVARFAGDTRCYVVITTYVGVVTGFGNAVPLLILGVDFAILWGGSRLSAQLRRGLGVPAVRRKPKASSVRFPCLGIAGECLYSGSEIPS